MLNVFRSKKQTSGWSFGGSRGYKNNRCGPLQNCKDCGYFLIDIYMVKVGVSFNRSSVTMLRIDVSTQHGLRVQSIALAGGG